MAFGTSENFIIKKVNILDANALHEQEAIFLAPSIVILLKMQAMQLMKTMFTL